MTRETEQKLADQTVSVPRSVLNEALNAMARGYERIHSLPRNTDTALADRIEKAKVALRDAAAPSPDTGKMGGEGVLREALRRLSLLTPGAANAATAHDLHLTVKAIADEALCAPVSGGEGEAVAWVDADTLSHLKDGEGGSFDCYAGPTELPEGDKAVPLYTHPSDPAATERMRAALGAFINSPLTNCNALTEAKALARAALGEA